MPVFVLSHRGPIVLLLPLLYHKTPIIALFWLHNIATRSQTLFLCFGRCIVNV